MRGIKKGRGKGTKTELQIGTERRPTNGEVDGVGETMTTSAKSDHVTKTSGIRGNVVLVVGGDQQVERGLHQRIGIERGGEIDHEIDTRKTEIGRESTGEAGNTTVIIVIAVGAVNEGMSGRTRIDQTGINRTHIDGESARHLHRLHRLHLTHHHLCQTVHHYLRHLLRQSRRWTNISKRITIPAWMLAMFRPRAW